MNVEVHLGFRLKAGPLAELVKTYQKRTTSFRRMDIIENSTPARMRNEDGWNVVCASTGELWSTETMAELWRGREHAGMSTVRFAIGGPDGWPGHHGESWSFGRITLPHALAAVVLSEQIYRTLTILAGHPYHLGH